MLDCGNQFAALLHKSITICIYNKFKSQRIDETLLTWYTAECYQKNLEVVESTGRPGLCEAASRRVQEQPPGRGGRTPGLGYWLLGSGTQILQGVVNPRR